MADSLKEPKHPSSSIDSVIDQYQASGIPDKQSAHLFAYFGALYLFLLALPLMAFPRFLVVLLGPSLVNSSSSGVDGHEDNSLRTLNALEMYLARLAGLSFVTLAIILVLQTGAIPMTTSLSHSSAASGAAPYRQPTVFFTMLFFGVLGFASWNVGLKVIGSSGAFLGAWGLYVLMFAGDPQAEGKKSNMLFGDKKLS